MQEEKIVPPISPPPVADAGPDQTVESGDLVQLDGSGSSAPVDCPIISYEWTQTGGPAVVLDDPNSPTPTFTAPETETEQVDIVFQLVVTNFENIRSEPEVTITVTPGDEPPSPDKEGIIGSGNNIGIQGQKNTGNNAIGQDGEEGNNSGEENILQGQSKNQDSNVVS